MCKNAVSIVNCHKSTTKVSAQEGSVDKKMSPTINCHYDNFRTCDGSVLM